MTAQLVPINAGSASPIPIHRPVLLIGRHPECDVRIDVPQISRRHCCVAMAYDRILIRDLGSLNGVRVNGQRVEEVRLQPGDEVAIAQFLYRLDWSLPHAANSVKAPTKVQAPAAPPSIVADDDFIPLSE